jgi:hypothetical protein
MKLWPEFVDATTQENRQNICNTCTNNTLGVCSQCMCLIKIKTQLVFESCPIGNWSANGTVKFPNIVDYEGAAAANTQNNFQRKD